MIIFGSRTLTSSQGGGVFHCPRSDMQRNYDHKQLNRWFTLYFIPCIPMGSAGTYVECMSCGGTYGEEILSYDPESDRAETYALLRRLVVLGMVNAHETGPANIDALRNIMQDITKNFVTEQEIREDIQMAQSANVAVESYFRQQASSFTADGKVLLIQILREAVGPQGPVSMSARQTLEQAAAAVGMPHDMLEQIISGTEE